MKSRDDQNDAPTATRRRQLPSCRRQRRGTWVVTTWLPLSAWPEGGGAPEGGARRKGQIEAPRCSSRSTPRLLRSIMLAIWSPWRDVPRMPDAPFPSSPSCRPSAHSRPRSSSSFTKTLFVLSQTYAMMGIVSSTLSSSTAFAVPAKVRQSTFPAPFRSCAQRSIRSAQSSGHESSRANNPASTPSPSSAPRWLPAGPPSPSTSPSPRRSRPARPRCPRSSPPALLSAQGDSGRGRASRGWART